MEGVYRIGVISDTHGLLRPEALQALRGCRMILHAGDAGKSAILDELAALAPVQAVRGNIDRGPWAESLPKNEVIEIEGFWIYLLHDLSALDLNPAAAGFRVVISGHSHHPGLAERNGVLYLNPGSAGPRRFRLPITLVYLDLLHRNITAHLIDLETGQEIPFP